MRLSAKSIIRGVLLTIGVLGPTWLFFFAVLGFHHVYIIGILGSVVLNGETPPRPGDYVWGDFGVRFFPRRFALSFVLWALTVSAVLWVLKKREKPPNKSLLRTPGAPAADRQA